MKLCPADINEKSTSRNLSIFGRDGRIRTYECNSQSVVSYRLTTSLYKNKMGWIIGFEPTTSRATTWRSNQLSYIHHLLARLKGLEPLTYCLEGSCSIQLSYKRILKFGAGDGNRTHTTSLEGWDSTIELHPHISVQRWLLYTIKALLSSLFLKNI